MRFHSFNFKLAVIQALIDEDCPPLGWDRVAEQAQKGVYRAFFDRRKGRERVAAHPELVAFFTALALDPSRLAQLRVLSLDAGNEIYGIVAPFWDGEDELFTVDDLRDVVRLVRLERLEDTGLLAVRDASPLLLLPELRYLDISQGQGVRDEAVLAQLRDRGVELGGAVSEAISEASHEVERPSKSAEPYDEAFNRAHDLIWQEDEPRQALEILDGLIPEHASDADLWLEKGNAHQALDELEAAENAWHRCLELEPSSIFAHYGLANLRLDQRRYLDAMEHIDRAIDAGMDSWPEAWHIKAQLCEFLGDRRGSVRFFGQALDLYRVKLQGAVEDEARAEVLYQLACVHNRLGAADEALSHLEQAIALDPDEAERAVGDKDFKSLLNDRRFRRLTES